MVFLWRGAGILVVLFAAAGFIIGGLVGHGVSGSNDGTVFGIAAGFAIAAVANWFSGRSLNRPLQAQNVDVLKRHSFFFIPMEWWSVPMLLFSILCVGLATGILR
jgi:hypothetical protein